MSEPDTGGLPVPDDMTTQQREWTFERIGWGVMLLTVAAAGLGLFGPGLLSHTRAASADEMVLVEYEQHLRKGAPAELRVEVLPRALGSEEVRLALDAAYLEHMNLKHTVPPPVRSELSDTATVFVFRIGQARQKAVVTFAFEPEAGGLARTTLRVNGQAGVSVQHIIFP